MHAYTFRYFHLDGFLTHRVTRQCMTDDDARAWSHQALSGEYGNVEIERDDGVMLQELAAPKAN